MSKSAQKTDRRYRMKELCELTGLSRQTIHFYVQQGLLPPGEKTGRNMAYYSEGHLDRLRTIQKLQHERFLPLKAIKAILDGETDGFEPNQRQLLREVKARLRGSALAKPELTHAIDAASVCERHGVELSDLRRMAELHLLSLVEDDSGPRISADDEWLVAQWGRVRRLGFTGELGFAVDDLAIYEQAASEMFEYEKSRILERMTNLPPDRVAEMVEQILPVINQFITRMHTAHIRNFFASME